MIKIYYLNIIINMRKEYEKRIKRKKNINLSKSSQPGKTEKNYVTIWMKLLLYTEKKSRNVTEIIAYLNYMYWKSLFSNFTFSLYNFAKTSQTDIIVALFSSSFGGYLENNSVLFSSAFVREKSIPLSFLSTVGYRRIYVCRFSALGCCSLQLQRTPQVSGKVCCRTMVSVGR